MGPFDHIPDQRPIPTGTGLTLEDAIPTGGTRPRLVTTKSELREAIAAAVAAAAERTGSGEVTVGLVPTMGALHGGHAALVRRAREENDVVVSSIFVNPLQFGDPDDLVNYPRTLDADLDLLGACGCEIAFAPSVEEMYPGYPDAPVVSVSSGRMGEILEGASRPGHFDGVCTVVVKLWSLMMPPGPAVLRSYFGQKDAQQLAILTHTAADLDIPVDVRGVDIVRSPEGLALSSRNTRLDEAGLTSALSLSQALRTLEASAKGGEPLDVAAAARIIEETPSVDLDHLIVVDRESLEELDAETLAKPLERDALALVAAHVPPVRLIDNMVLPALRR